MPTLRALIADAETALTASPHAERAHLDAESLLLHLLNQSRAWLFTHSEDVSAPEIEEIGRAHV